MECREVSEQLAAGLGEPAGRAQWAPSGPAARAVEAHLRSCAACRADLESYQQLGTALSGLVEHTVDPPAWLHDTLIDSVHARLPRANRLRLPDALRARPAGTRPLASPRYAAAGGAVLLAGVAAGAVLLRGRRRRNAASELGTAGHPLGAAASI